MGSFDIQAHLFDTEAAADEAIAIINAAEGIPVPGGATQTYTQAFRQGEVWYIQADAVTIQYLGTPETFTIVLNDD